MFGRVIEDSNLSYHLDDGRASNYTITLYWQRVKGSNLSIWIQSPVPKPLGQPAIKLVDCSRIPTLKVVDTISLCQTLWQSIFGIPSEIRTQTFRDFKSPASASWANGTTIWLAPRDLNPHLINYELIALTIMLKAILFGG